MKKVLLLVMLAVVVLSGCFSSADQTQYIVIQENGTLTPFAIIEYNIFKDGTITAKITQYQEEYLSPSRNFPGHMNLKYKKLPVEFEKLTRSTVFDKDNFEGNLSFLNVKIVNGKWVSPIGYGFQCIGYLKWITEITLSTKEYHKWVPGTKHPTKHLIAYGEENKWLPDGGYEWVRDLSKERQKELDTVIKKMTENNESAENIQLVNDDFKNKYGEVKRDADGWAMVKKIGQEIEKSEK